MNIKEIRNRVELTNQNKLYHAGDGDVREDLTADWVAEFKEVVDAELFLHARTDIEYLLSIIERQEKALKDAKEALDNQYRFNGGIIENNKAYMAIFNELALWK